jgi:hypothetical protein
MIALASVFIVVLMQIWFFLIVLVAVFLFYIFPLSLRVILRLNLH